MLGRSLPFGGAALDHLEKLFKVPNSVTPQWTRIDPAFKSLQGNARYEKLVAGS